MQGISITTQRAQLDIRTKRAELIIERPRPRMNVRTRRARMTINRRMPTFKVNWEQVRAESGLVPSIRFAIENGQFGSQQGWQAVGEIAQNGDRMMDSTGLDVIADISRERSRRQRPEGEFNVAPMPRNLPQVEWDHGEFSVEWEPYELEVTWDMPKPQIRFNPHTVEIKLSRYPLVKITYDPEFFEKRIKKLDKKI
jgi:hypothetical protein